ncbi:hypothetical protein E5R92_04005 [Candidatus Pelagibacter giovannonii]|uniref:Uncharacterized protein n=1 Tax=Candidatus Pelagibacter giovannonii TaxID=2563896 RepID=A0A6H1Q291_9PROT|nr:hypothetical protein [Candidatus Pelagibacter giovannonii]QIZ20944.1 hypothetical protein E5R92_04005 [Candidatus Pelagibacter giovannonii]
MKNLKLLSKNYFLVILFSLFFGFATNSQEPVDIWEVGKKKLEENINLIEDEAEKNIPQNTIYEMQSQKEGGLSIEETQTLISKETKLVGIYDPAENGLDINMWSNSNGDQILNIFKRIDKLELSRDAVEILDILLLTNAHYPEMNISKEQFLEIKSKWLIKHSNFDLIEQYLLNNQIVNEHPKLTKHLVDHYLSQSNVKKACEIFSEIKEPIQDLYLSKFDIYCLINNNKRDEAQLLIDLQLELGIADKFFIKKIDYLMGYNTEPEIEVSEKTILDFHLSHRTNPEFKFEPKDTTSKQIWKYLSTSNLLDNIIDIELTDIDKINSIEKATHEGNYTEKELFELYKRFQFNITQLLNIKESSKVLSTIETRALIYQGILITTEIENKLQLMNALKNSFKNDGIENAFNIELQTFLRNIEEDKVPSNFTTFYQNNLDNEKMEQVNIKINNKILHQSKLINYLKLEKSKKDPTKDINDFLKKIKKNKKYFFSKKDIILVEAFKSDGIKILNKYNDLYQINDSEIPSDIQIFVNSGDMAAALLRIVEVIGQDNLNNIDEDTLYFIISTLNQLNVDPLRNRILFKILPLKV